MTTQQGCGIQSGVRGNLNYEDLSSDINDEELAMWRAMRWAFPIKAKDSAAGLAFSGQEETGVAVNILRERGDKDQSCGQEDH